MAPTLAAAGGAHQFFATPHVQLLFKAGQRLAKDDADLAAVLPRLAPARRRWLHDALRAAEGAEPPWLAVVRP